MLEHGSLLPFALAMAATLVMYYEESDMASKVDIVTARMREALVRQKLADNVAEAHAILKKWGEAIKTECLQS